MTKQLLLDISDDMITPRGLLGVPRSLPTETPINMSVCIHMIHRLEGDTDIPLVAICILPTP